ncbi:MAG TPA: hypothetical protein VHT91_02920 [Kofleriaceae bacterium]|jgi:hypothetical protein|nr:hypothetical protein [Kofleriaceae bacterium]
MTTGKLCYAIVTILVATIIGCNDIQEPNQSMASQAITQCELDCPGGPVFTCTTLPCSVTATSLTCNGTVTNCPACVPTTCAAHGAECGSLSNGCGGTLNCGSCPAGRVCSGNFCECPAGKDDCCGDGRCLSQTLCQHLGCSF